MYENKYLGTIMSLDISEGNKGFYYIDDHLFLRPGESIDDFCNQFKELIKDPEEQLIQAVEDYLNEMDTKGGSSPNRIRKALDRVKAAKP